MQHNKPSGVAAAQAAATDIGYAMQMVEGFEPVKLPPMEEVGRDTDGTPIYRNNWGAYDPWISVKVRLPEWAESVLVYDGLQMFQAGFMPNKREGLPYFYHTDRGHLPHVTHWMPLPPKPVNK